MHCANLSVLSLLTAVHSLRSTCGRSSACGDTTPCLRSPDLATRIQQTLQSTIPSFQILFVWFFVRLRRVRINPIQKILRRRGVIIPPSRGNRSRRGFHPQFIIFVDHLVQSNRPIFGRLGGLLIKRGRCWDPQTHFRFVYVVTVHPLSVAIKGRRRSGRRAWIVETVTVAVAFGGR